MEIVFMLLAVMVVTTVVICKLRNKLTSSPGRHFMIFSPTEIWSLTDQDEIQTINIAEPTLNLYESYPEIFLVNSDFCTRN